MVTIIKSQKNKKKQKKREGKDLFTGEFFEEMRASSQLVSTKPGFLSPNSGV